MSSRRAEQPGSYLLNRKADRVSLKNIAVAFHNDSGLDNFDQQFRRFGSKNSKIILEVHNITPQKSVSERTLAKVQDKMAPAVQHVFTPCSFLGR
jgi:hypothetical protein